MHPLNHTRNALSRALLALFLAAATALAVQAEAPAGENSAASSKASPLRVRDLQVWLRGLHPVKEPSVDRIIVGDPETVVRGIAVMWTPTWSALRQALADGCNVVVAHEPTFFSHFDLDGFEEAAGKISPAAEQAMVPTRDAKLHWIQENGLVVIRAHDVVDHMPEGVADSLVKELGFAADDVLVRKGPYRVVRIAPAVTAEELGKRLAKAFARIGQPGVAFYGDPQRRVEKLGLGTGYGCVPWDFVALGADMCVTIDDRIKTWIETEWADDAGFPMIVIHHGTSEEWGVHSLHKKLVAAFPQVPVKLQVQGFRARWIDGR
jgi:putative NIF3 family GTP cyclohydrolase 1 type 2